MASPLTAGEKLLTAVYIALWFIANGALGVTAAMGVLQEVRVVEVNAWWPVRRSRDEKMERASSLPGRLGWTGWNRWPAPTA